MKLSGLLRTSIVLLMLVTTSAWLQAQQYYFRDTTTSYLGTGILNAGWGTTKFADYDNDGRLEFYYSGDNSDQGKYNYAKVYKWDGLVYSDVTATAFGTGADSLISNRAGMAQWIDFNNDGYLDLVISGHVVGPQATQALARAAAPGGKIAFYKNNQNGTFSNVTTTIFGMADPYTLATGGTLNTGSVANTWAKGSPYLGALEFGDYDKDGDQDMVITGILEDFKTVAGYPYALGGDKCYIGQLYKNNGNGTFSLVAAPVNGLTGLNWTAFPSAKFTDVNHDGYLDIVMGGYSDGTRIYLNKKNGTFNTGTTFLSRTAYGNTNAWGDYNNDGYQDAVYSYWTPGSAANTGYGRLEFYKGRSDGGMRRDTANLNELTTSGGPAVANTVNSICNGYSGINGKLSLGDYDHDGDLDLALAGNCGANAAAKVSNTPSWTSTWVAKILNNNLIKGTGNATFAWNTTDSANFINTIPTGFQGNACQWLDINNDGRLDVFMAGSTDATVNSPNAGIGSAVLLMNMKAETNSKPGKPTNLKALGNALTYPYANFSWDAPTDDKTPATSLTYEIMIGTAPGKCDIATVLSDPSTGFCRVPVEGPIRDYDKTNFKLGNGIPGTYYWSIHAIDGGYMGGDWAEGPSFDIVLPTPTRPVYQASHDTLLLATQQTLTVQWNNSSDGRKVVVFAKRGNDASERIQLTDNKVYAANATFALGDSVFSADGTYWYCVYNDLTSGSDKSSCYVQGLYPNTAYQFAVVLYNASLDNSTINYLTTAATKNPAIISTLAYPIPAGYVSGTSVAALPNNILFTARTDTTQAITFSGQPYSNGVRFGTDLLIVAKEVVGNDSTKYPFVIDAHRYIGTNCYGTGSQLTDRNGVPSGWFVVRNTLPADTFYKGSANWNKASFYIKGLKAGKYYQTSVIPYGGGPNTNLKTGAEVYLHIDSTTSQDGGTTLLYGNPKVFHSLFPIPTTQASALQVDGSSTLTNLVLNWRSGTNTQGYIVFHATTIGAAAPTVTDETTYTTTGTDNSGAWTVAYVGADTSFNYSGLTPATTHQFVVYAYNADPNNLNGTQRYLTTITEPQNKRTFTTVDISNGVPAMGLTATAVTDSSMHLAWSAGASDGFVVLATTTTEAAPYIEDGTSLYGGQTLGNWTCLYKGTGININYNKFKQNTTYKIAVASYYGDTISKKYLNDYETAAGGNVISQLTLTAKPKVQVTALDSAGARSNMVKLKFTQGSGQKTILFLNTSLSATVPTLVDGTAYAVGATVDGWACVYNGTDATATITSVEYPTIAAATPYLAVGYSYNENVGAGTGKENLYYTATSTNFDTITTAAAVIAPTTKATFGTTVRADNKLTIPITVGNGAKRVVFAIKGATPYVAANMTVIPTLPTITNNTTYTASANTKDGLATVVNGWSCIANGAVTSVVPTGLTSGSNYYIAVYEYNGNAGEEKYFATAASKGDTTAKRLPVITITTAKTVAWGSANFAIGATSTVTGVTPTITFASSAPAVAAIAGTDIDVLDAGVTTITASQVATDSTRTALNKTMTLRVKKAPITFVPVVTNLGTNVTLAAVTGTGTAATYAIGRTAVATLTGSVLTPVSVDTTIITVSGDATNDTILKRVLYVRALASGLAFDALPTGKRFGDPAFDITNITPTASTNGVTFASSNTTSVTVSGTTLTIVGVGTATITATQKGDLNTADASLSKDITIAKGTATLTLGDSTYAYDGTAKDVTALISVAGVSPIISYQDVAGTSLASAPVNAGNYKAIASIDDANYNASTVTSNLTITKAPATVTISDLAKTYTGSAQSVTVVTEPVGKTTLVTYNTASSAVNAGTYAVVATIDEANYEGTGTASLVISKAPLLVKGDSSTVKLASELDLSTLPSAYEMTGFVGADLESDITGKPAISTLATTTSPKGTYVITVDTGTLKSTNYKFILKNGKIIILGSVGVNGVVAKEISLFPNPVVSGTVTIKDYAKGTSLKITSLSGGLILNKNLEGTSEVVDISNIPAGSYLFQFITSQGVVVKQVTKL